MKDWLGCCPHARHLYSVICAHHSQSNWQEQKQKAGPHCSGSHLNYCARRSPPLLSAPRELFSSCKSIFRKLQSSIICETSPNQTCRQALAWEIRCSPAFEVLLFEKCEAGASQQFEMTPLVGPRKRHPGREHHLQHSAGPPERNGLFEMEQFNLRCRWCFSCHVEGKKVAYKTVLAAQVHWCPLSTKASWVLVLGGCYYTGRYVLYVYSFPATLVTTSGTRQQPAGVTTLQVFLDLKFQNSFGNQTRLFWCVFAALTLFITAITVIWFWT